MPHNRDDLPEGPIEPNKPAEEIRQEPYTMPAGFEWSDLDISNAEQRMELYKLLAQNYVDRGHPDFRGKDSLSRNAAICEVGYEKLFLL